VGDETLTRATPRVRTQPLIIPCFVSWAHTSTYLAVDVDGCKNECASVRPPRASYTDARTVYVSRWLNCEQSEKISLRGLFSAKSPLGQRRPCQYSSFGVPLPRVQLRYVTEGLSTGTLVGNSDFLSWPVRFNLSSTPRLVLVQFLCQQWRLLASMS
jgi:hypothetical protein